MEQKLLQLVETFGPVCMRACLPNANIALPIQTFSFDGVFWGTLSTS